MDDLDDLFATVRSRAETHAVPPSAVLLARIEADALREQPKRAPPPAPKERAWLGGVFGVFLGGPSAALGLTLAAVSGLWLGLAQPVVADYMTGYLSAGAGMDLLPGESALWTGE